MPSFPGKKNHNDREGTEGEIVFQRNLEFLEFPKILGEKLKFKLCSRLALYAEFLWQKNQNAKIRTEGGVAI